MKDTSETELFRALMAEIDPDEYSTIADANPADSFSTRLPNQPLGFGVHVASVLFSPVVWKFVRELAKAGALKASEVIGEDFAKWLTLRSKDKKVMLDPEILSTLRSKLDHNYLVLGMPENMRTKAAEATLKVFLKNPDLIRRLTLS